MTEAVQTTTPQGQNQPHSYLHKHTYPSWSSKISSGHVKYAFARIYIILNSLH